MALFSRLMALAPFGSRPASVDDAAATAHFRHAARQAVADMRRNGVTPVGIDENGVIVEVDSDLTAIKVYDRSSRPERG